MSEHRATVAVTAVVAGLARASAAAAFALRPGCEEHADGGGREPADDVGRVGDQPDADHDQHDTEHDTEHARHERRAVAVAQAAPQQRVEDAATVERCGGQQVERGQPEVEPADESGEQPDGGRHVPGWQLLRAGRDEAGSRSDHDADPRSGR